MTPLLKKDKRWAWGPEHKAAFEHVKRLLTKIRFSCTTSLRARSC